MKAAALCLRDPLLFAAFSRLRRNLRKEARTDEYRKTAISGGEAFRAMEGALLSRMLSNDEERTSALMREIFYSRIFELFAGIQPFPGVREALAAFRSLRLPLGLLSDMPPERKLELMGLASCFDVIQCSEDSGFLKPEAASFLKLAESLGHDPKDILYIGNNPRYDLAGARNAGMQAAILSRRSVRGADFCFYRWGNLVRFVESNSHRSRTVL